MYAAKSKVRQRIREIQREALAACYDALREQWPYQTGDAFPLTLGEFLVVVARSPELIARLVGGDATHERSVVELREKFSKGDLWSK